MLQGAVVDKTKQAQPPRARQVKGQAPRRASTRWVPAVLERLWQAASRRRQDRQAAKQSPHSPTPCCPPRVPVRSGRPSQTGWRSRTWPSPPATRLHEAAAAHCRWLLRWRSHVSPFPGRRSRRSRSRRGGRWSTLAWFQASNALSDGSRGTTGAHLRRTAALLGPGPHVAGTAVQTPGRLRVRRVTRAVWRRRQRLQCWWWLWPPAPRRRRRRRLLRLLRLLPPLTHRPAGPHGHLRSRCGHPQWLFSGCGGRRLCTHRHRSRAPLDLC